MRYDVKCGEGANGGGGEGQKGKDHVGLPICELLKHDLQTPVVVLRHDPINRKYGIFIESVCERKIPCSLHFIGAKLRIILCLKKSLKAFLFHLLFECRARGSASLCLHMLSHLDEIQSSRLRL